MRDATDVRQRQEQRDVGQLFRERCDHAGDALVCFVQISVIPHVVQETRRGGRVKDGTCPNGAAELIREIKNTRRNNNNIPYIASYTRHKWDPPAGRVLAGTASSRPPPPRVRRAVGGTCDSRHTGRPVRALTVCASPPRQRCTRAQRGERKSRSKETRAGQCGACGDSQRSQ